MRRQTSGDTYHDACLCNGHSDVSPGRTWWMRRPFNVRGGTRVTSFPSLSFVYLFIFFQCIRQNTAMEDEWRTTYLICGGRRSIYLSQTWGPARRRAADGWGSGRIWTGTGRTAPWLRSGCCSSAGVSLQGTGGGSGALQSVRNKGYTLGVVTGGERERGREGGREVERVWWGEKCGERDWRWHRLVEGFRDWLVLRVGMFKATAAGREPPRSICCWKRCIQKILQLRQKLDQKWMKRQLFQWCLSRKRQIFTGVFWALDSWLDRKSNFY